VLFVKKIVRKLSLYYLLPLSVLLILVLQLTPLVIQESRLNADNAFLAREKAKTIWRQFSSSQTFVEIELNIDDVTAISEVASYTFDNTEVAIGFNRFGVTIASTTGLSPFHINLYCTISPKSHDSFYHIDGCDLGNLYIPGIIINSAMRFGAWLLFDAGVSETVKQLLANIKVTDDKIVLIATKNNDFKERINNSLKDVAGIAKTVSRNANVEPEKIQQYLAKLEQFTPVNNSLSHFVNQAMHLAMINSIDGDPIEENTAAIWALAIKFGSKRFASLAGVETNVSGRNMTLRGRQDLALHFLYSAILQQLGRENIGLKIGEFKEILDSRKGGSGFSFADLAGDKAGLAFAEFLTRDNESALLAQEILVGRYDESTFFPFIHDLPEGMREGDFSRVVGGIDSKNYNELEVTIDQKIAKLTLYSKEQHQGPVEGYEEQAFGSKPTLGKWLKIDTHIHTRYSDGNKTVSEIADKAEQFGCDAIAITDHGDKELTNVLSKRYFADIQEVSLLHPNMTIMPGFEWNIPPFGGREHATVLFADTPSMKRDLRYFRENFDHYKEYKKQFLSAKPAFDWLNNYADKAEVKPVVIYNHPSRKDFETQENQYDLENWSQDTDVVIGFSGAPGHQRKRGKNNGSYQTLLRTINGWDPSIAIVGGEWDRLLQKGYRVTAARAASDFHNTGMDYWPCEFSSTHILSQSNSHNDVLTALRHGQMWAQHGNFIESVMFSATNEKGIVHNMGEVVNVARAGQTVNINLEISLQAKDWQGFPTSLDELELIIITRYGIDVIPIYIEANMRGKTLNFESPQLIDSDLTVVRVRGRSIQPEMHHYMFYTNPIYIKLKDLN
jgi:hypothetical protein